MKNYKNEQNPDLPKYLIYLNLIVGSISILFLFFSFISFCFVKQIQKYMLTLIRRLFISSLFTTITYMLPYTLFDLLKKQKGCEYTGFGMVWFEHSLYLNSLIITITSFYNAKRKDTNNYELSQCRHFLYIFISYVFPFGIAIVTWKLNVLGKSYYSCWIDPNVKNGRIMNWIFYIYYWLLLFINILLILIIFRFILKISSNQLNRERDLIMKSVTNLLSYPLIQFVTVLPMTIAKLVNYSDKHLITLVLKEISLVLVLIQGALFVFAYCWNYNVIRDICKKTTALVEEVIPNQSLDYFSDEYSISAGYNSCN